MSRGESLPHSSLWRGREGQREVWPVRGAVTKSEWYKLGAKSCLGSSDPGGPDHRRP